MYSLYSFFFSAWVIFMTPFFLFNAYKHKKYLPSLRERLGRLPATLRADGRPTIWFHACSVGETLSLQPLAQVLHERFPEARFVFSTITKTGQAIARERFSRYGAGNAFYFPIDLAWVAGRVLDWIRPSLLITVDTEIWPNVLHEAHRRSVPVIMVNGRISAESFQYYRWVQPWLGRVFQNYRLMMMKSAEDAQRIQRLGAPPSKIRISGNIKYDRGVVERDVSEAQARALETALGLDPAGAKPLIVAGSTHEGEEQTLLDALRRVRQTPGLESTRLLIAPRHPERFGQVTEMAERAGFAVVRRSGAEPDASGAAVLILDTLGELAAAYQFATVVFVGGTLIPHGGQSIMEPALYAKPIVIGPSMDNFPQIIDEFQARGGIAQIAARETDREAQKEQLAETFARLLQDETARGALGSAARSVFDGNQGATQFTLDQVAAVFEEILAR